ncbi:MAG: helix-turn-helix transcriptional regulator [Caulobacterales bacterium]|nr:helix-turn-helix transcriptional regulator [Caulobacterales bacterium]
MDETIGFEWPGRFKIVSCWSSTAPACDEAYQGLQISLPLPRALYCARVTTRDGRSVVHRLGARDILAVPAGLPHELIWRRSAPVLSLMLTQEFISDAVGAGQSAPEAAFTVRDPFISAAGSQLWETLKLATPGPAMVEALVTAIVYRLVAEGSSRDQALIGSRTGPVLTDVQRARLERHIEGALDQTLTTGSLATWLGLSRWRFVKRFHSTYAMSPLAFVAERRFVRACRLLDESTLSILQIALEVGLSHSHFSRSFLGRFGYTPSEYRRGLCR